MENPWSVIESALKDGHSVHLSAVVDSETESVAFCGTILSEPVKYVTAPTIAKLLQRLSGEDAKKTCTACRLAKPLEAFSLNRTSPDGLVQRCKSCESARQKAARERDAKRRKQKQKQRQLVS